ncbi:antitoxin [Sphingomonas sp. 8AM]|uniref:antitoxin n=1 Tax=Sphingomonas sp. 8AM TaxID=2653170 RepID=UPI0012F188F8|nr:AbrB family transcriptional regulator [Sphingomonas sp. 8AM]VXC62289.1 AbrB family transcriptional regulator [Sphingomonas sp. 8AM]
MGNEYRAKVFKSGNSVALRLPKGLGFGEGDDVVIAPHDDGSFSLWRESDGAQVLMSLYGSVSEGFMADGRGDTRADVRDWSPRPGAAAA